MARRNSCPDEAILADITGLLLSKGARVPRSGKDTTALLEAVRNRHFLMADILLKSGARTDSTDSNGDNVLHMLSRSAGHIAYDIKSRQRRIADFQNVGIPNSPSRRHMTNWKTSSPWRYNAATRRNLFWKAER